MLFQEERRKKMSKVLLKINRDQELTYPADGYILGIDKYSYLFGKTYLLEEVRRIKEENLDKEIYVSFNRIIFNDLIEDYKNMLLKIDELGVDGIIVGDVAALTYDLKTNIILDQMHLNNSYYTINHYSNNGVKGIILTNDITLNDINSIQSNTNVKLFKQAFGYPHLSTSNRKLVTNYLTHFKINSKEDSYEICENKSDNYYKVIEDDFGTHILGDKPLNLLSVYNDLNVDYMIIDGYLIDDVKPVLDAFLNKDIKASSKIDEKYNSNNGFISKETIYKVKKDER